ncbi:restriction endonuclease subunit S [Streptomyces spectabilis]|uniref:restriction endonuclease subunit S n=1 Tax=Streptomyces spectabilis TaxID=68270 RepID=UPI0033D7A356
MVDNRGRTCPTTDEGIKLIATNCISDEALYPRYEKVRYVSQETYDGWFRAHPEPGDLIFVCKGSPGRVALTPDPVDFCIAQDMVAVRPDASKIDPLYLFAILRSPEIRNRIENLHVGTMIPHFKKGDFHKLMIPVPERGVQEGIGEIYYEISRKIAVNERIATMAIELADAVYLHSVSGLEPGDETFGSVAAVGGGGTPSTKVESYWGGDIAWTTPSDVTALPSPYLFNTGRKITSEGLEACASPLYPANSIFMTSRATIGAFALPQIPAAVNQGFIVVTPPGEPMRWWLFHEMRSRVPEMISLCNGSTFLELSRKNFKALKVRLPGADEMEKFAGVAAPLHGRAVRATEENHLLVEIRDTLLPQLMSGRLRVKDAEKIVEGHV